MKKSSQEFNDQIGSRKIDHLKLAATAQAQMEISNGLSRLFYESIALPELNLCEINTTLDFFDYKLQQPLLIASMSGGVKKASKLNATLATAAEACGIAMGIGSMRIALEDTKIAKEFNLRKYAPNIPILANLGGSELLNKNGVYSALRCIEISDAVGLIIHLNPLQEAIQPEGNKNWRGLSNSLESLVKASPVPIIVKEVGHGIGPNSANKLSDIGIKWIDVAAAGGTSWAGIESMRTRYSSNNSTHNYSTFHNFGMPLVECIRGIKKDPRLCDINLIASGGIRSGLDVAKCLSLGCTLASAAQPFLLAAQDGEQPLIDLINQWQFELAITCLCVGAKSVVDLSQVELHTVK